jgi:hypothetical protein
VQVAEQRPHRVLERQRVPLGAAGCGEQHRHAAQGIRVEHVDERLEQAAVAGGEDRRDEDRPIGCRQLLDRRRQLGRRESGEQVVGDVLRQIAELDHVHLGGHALGCIVDGGQPRDGRLREPIGKQPG